jgi:hypothetical protein
LDRLKFVHCVIRSELWNNKFYIKHINKIFVRNTLTSRAFKHDLEDGMHLDSWSTFNRFPTKPPAQSRHGIAREAMQINQRLRRTAEAKEARQQHVASLGRLLPTLAALGLYRAAAL